VNKSFTANTDTVGMIISLQKLAELNLNHTTIELRNIEVGDEYTKRAFKLSKEYGDKELMLIVNAILQFAAINHRFGKEDLPKAEKLAAQMLDLIGNEPQLQRFRVIVLNSLATHYNASGEVKKVYDTFKSILNESDTKEIPANYYGLMLNLSFICIDLKKYNEALEYLNLVLENTEEEKFKLLRAVQTTEKDHFGKFTTLIGIGLADTELHAQVQVSVVIA
jgi:tetratricopeptide (TPR) repeat protein